MSAPSRHDYNRARKARLGREIEAARELEASLAGESAPPEDLRRANAALVAALSAIVLETMPYAPSRPRSSDSWLPDDLIEDAQQALELATGSRIGENRS